MIPINDYQKLLYSTLQEEFTTKIFDDVPKNTKLPVVILGDYIISSGISKSKGYSITQNIDIYSEYEGKKEINDYVSRCIESVSKIFNQEIIDNWEVSSLRLSDSTISRVEDIYVANMKFEIVLEQF